MCVTALVYYTKCECDRRQIRICQTARHVGSPCPEPWITEREDDEDDDCDVCKGLTPPSEDE